MYAKELGNLLIKNSYHDVKVTKVVAPGKNKGSFSLSTRVYKEGMEALQPCSVLLTALLSSAAFLPGTVRRCTISLYPITSTFPRPLCLVVQCSVASCSSSDPRQMRTQSPPSPTNATCGHAQNIRARTIYHCWQDNRQRDIHTCATTASTCATGITLGQQQ